VVKKMPEANYYNCMKHRELVAFDQEGVNLQLSALIKTIWTSAQRIKLIKSKYTTARDYRSLFGRLTGGFHAILGRISAMVWVIDKVENRKNTEFELREGRVAVRGSLDPEWLM